MLQATESEARTSTGEQPLQSLEALLLPIDPERPAGDPMSGSAVFRAIEEARRSDDPTLPLGPWERELKRAEWPRVSALTSAALTEETKDLQLAAWWLEAEINRRGYLGLAAGAALLNGLCERFWNELYPLPEDGAFEHRLNIVHWIDEKLLPTVRLIPIATVEHKEESFSWADLEQAHRNEQIRSQRGSSDASELEGTTIEQFNAALSSTPTEQLQQRYQGAAEALGALETFARTLNERFPDDAPSLGRMRALLDDIINLIGSELGRRGVELSEEAPPEPTGEIDADASGPRERVVTDAPTSTGPIQGRVDAYTRLGQAAEYLMHIEPHSPVPYLVKRAIEWGSLDTAELYRQVFIQRGGSLNIFELLGLQVEATDEDDA